MYKVFSPFIVLMIAALHPFNLSAQNSIGSTGNIGIGTTTPVVKLSVYGSSDDSAAISLQSGSNSRFYIQQGGTMLKIGGITPGIGAINVLSTGKVGIGTNAPESTLDVKGPFRLGINTVGTAYGIGFDRINNAQLYGTTSAGLLLGGDATGVDATILPNGNVGIGTNAPESMLDVNGTFRLGITTGGMAYAIGLTRLSNAQLYGTTSAGLLLGGDATGVDATILPNGNVGIGTINPAYKLDVQNGSVNIGTGANIFYRAGSYLSIGNMSNTNTPYIAFNAFLTTSDIATGKNLVTPNYNSGGALIIRGEAGNSGLHFYQKNYANGTPPYDINTFTEVLTLTSAGNVGIGTTTTGDYKLAVNGAIGARRVKVTQAGWADFVFDPAYNLSPLSEIENYVKANRHLPDVPAAAEVEKDGLDLGEMDKKLLQKIEELTLYLIEEHKRNDAQLEMIKALKAEVAQLNTKGD